VLFPGGTGVTLIARTVSGKDALGNDVFTPVQTSILRCGFDPGHSVEDVQGRDMVTVQPRLLLPPDAALPAAIDAVIVNGVTYEVDGSPNSMTNPLTGWHAGTVVNLKEVTG
jgi:hypothetical protein